jgi:hypothetical protein
MFESLNIYIGNRGMPVIFKAENPSSCKLDVFRIVFPHYNVRATEE